MWKIDITTVFSAIVVEINKMVENSSLDENDCLMYFLNEVYGEPKKDIWQPLK